MANEETTINGDQIDINDTIGMKLNANQAELYSTDGNVPILAKCGTKEITLIDENGNTYLKSLTVNGKNIESMASSLEDILQIFRNARWSKSFSIEASSWDKSNKADLTYAGMFEIPFKGASYYISCSNISSSLTGSSLLDDKESNGVLIYKDGLIDYGGTKLCSFSGNGEDSTKYTLNNNLYIYLDTNETTKSGHGSWNYEAGSCTITLRLAI